ncbi:MAG: NADH-quinone oxidoreductase subunit C [Tepidiformaceae bacterium]
MTSEEKAVAPSYPGIAATVHKLLPDVPFVASETKTDVDLSVAADGLLPLITGLKEKKDLAFDYLVNIAGVDYEAEGMAVKYQLYSFTHGHRIQVTVPTGQGHPHIPSLTALYPAADWHEREAAEMFGFVFDGHPNLKNLLLEEDLRIHPLLKAHPLQPMELKQGIESGPPGYTF